MTIERETAQPQLPIDEVVIDPKAEAITAGPGKTTGRDESNFFAEDAERYKLLHNGQKLGHLGKLWGSSSSAPTNIAGMVLILSIVIVCVSFFPIQSPGLEDLRKWLYGLTTTSIGFLFGAKTSKAD
ncbi:hypothetical protein [Pseudomonas huanghezhanensis]|uniref:hypothetical protein n=1 Tax=Pseudomonas huanghezhanensis TaxID=3002903 RepID=UPI0022854344|nr:hypothetical protein [Pseudomonas sp. BSw22131]